MLPVGRLLVVDGRAIKLKPPEQPNRLHDLVASIASDERTGPYRPARHENGSYDVARHGAPLRVCTLVCCDFADVSKLPCLSTTDFVPSCGRIWHFGVAHLLGKATAHIRGSGM